MMKINRYLISSGQTEAGSAEEQPARDSQIKENRWRGKSFYPLSVLLAMPNKTLSLEHPLVI